MSRGAKVSKTVSHAGRIKTVTVRISSGNSSVSGKAKVQSR